MIGLPFLSSCRAAPGWRRRPAAAAAAALVLALPLTPTPELGAAYTRPTGPRLRELAAERGIEFGFNLPYLVFGKSPNNWAASPLIADEQAIVLDHATMVSAGWEMFPGHTWTGPDQYDYTGSEHFLDWCRTNGLATHGHGLGYVRPGAPAWLDSVPLTNTAEREGLREVYRRYLDTTLGRLGDRVDLWDVGNETLYPGAGYNSSGYITTKPLWQAYQTSPNALASGIEYLVDTFTRAHALAPAAELIYLDFQNEVRCAKSDQMYALVQTLRERGAGPDGVGFQMHLNTGLQDDKNPAVRGHPYPTDDEYFDSLRDNLTRFADLGLSLWATELEVSLRGDRPVAEELDRQAEIYRRVFEVFLEQPGRKGIKGWGILEKDVWGGAVAGRPHLFDAAGQAKPAFFAVRQALAEYRPVVLALADFAHPATLDGWGWTEPWQLSNGASLVAAAPADPVGPWGQPARLRLSGTAEAVRSRTSEPADRLVLSFRWRSQRSSGTSARLSLEQDTGDGWQTRRTWTLPSGVTAWQASHVTLPPPGSSASLRLRWRLAPAGAQDWVDLDEVVLRGDRPEGATPDVREDLNWGWTYADDLATGWVYASSLGFLYRRHEPWLYHPAAGWLYTTAPDLGGRYLWNPGRGWLFGQPLAYGSFLYHFASATWFDALGPWPETVPDPD